MHMLLSYIGLVILLQFAVVPHLDFGLVTLLHFGLVLHYKLARALYRGEHITMTLPHFGLLRFGLLRFGLVPRLHFG